MKVNPDSQKMYFFGLCAFGLVSLQFAYAEVWIPDNEFTGYFDSNDIYTVVGAVKNSEKYPVVPTVVINILDGNRKISESYTLPAASPSKDMPFKIKLSQVSTENPVLEKPGITFVPTLRTLTNVEIIYDKTLVKHSDGHVSGFIVNNDIMPVYGVKIYALINDKDGKLIDVGKTVESIEKIEPSQKKEFTMYPDPAFASQVGYYSCFVIGEEPIIPMFVQREGKRFDFRYVSSGYFDDAKFDDDKKALSLFARNPWPITVYANIEFPREFETQDFKVYIDNELVYAPISMDEFGNWHVAFNLEPQTSSQVLISGFEGSKASAVQTIEPYYLLGIIPAAIIAGI
ncbi:MAG: hypothetical protein ACREAE_07155, partial [Nitrosopumilaceae archaeon]